MTAREDPKLIPIRWRPSGDPLVPYEGAIAGQRWQLRLNDFPEEPLYTLLVDGREALSFSDWPDAWEREGDG